MSVVGPRPWAVSYIPYFTKEERKRHLVRPGLSGWAQVNGRTAANWDERLKYDICCIIICLFSVMYVTCYSRQPSIIEQNGILPFWSYHMILNGNSILLNEVILNILLFIPTGYILSILLRKKSYAIIVCFLISSGIEITQLITHRGLISRYNNTAGIQIVI